MPGDYQNNAAAAVNEVRTVVDACIANGIYAIVDWHPGNNENRIWRMPKVFLPQWPLPTNDSEHMYEPWNEPNMNYNDWATVVKPYDDTLVKTIRAVDPDNIVICGTPTWSQDVDVASRSPITISPMLRIRCISMPRPISSGFETNWIPRSKTASRFSSPSTAPARTREAASLTPWKRDDGGTILIRTTSGAPTGRWRPMAKRRLYLIPAPAQPDHGQPQISRPRAYL